LLWNLKVGAIFWKIFGIKEKVETIQFSYEHVKSQLMKDWKNLKTFIRFLFEADDECESLIWIW
jgi:hypothetical protein